MTTSQLLAAYHLPPSWNAIRLRWISRRYAGGTPDTKNPDYWESGTIPWLNSGSVNQGVITMPSDFITDIALRESSAKWIPAGSLVMALAGQGKTKATVGFLEIPATGNQSLAAIVPEKIDGKYLYWWLTSQYRTLRNLSSQDGRDGLNLEMIGSIFCPCPGLETQRRIARFLDEKMAQIDGLIDKKRALLARLVEKRRALITRAVTKGLNPAAPLKPSGIDWLGDIPAHWDLTALGYRYEVQLGRMLNAERADGENLKPYLRVFDVQWGKINTENLPTMDFPPDAQERYRLRSGDLLVNEGGSYVGRSAIWRGELEECYYQKALHRLRPFRPTRDHPEFFYFVMEAATRNAIFVAGGNQTTIDHLTAEQFGHYRFGFPPYDEQVSIVLDLSKALLEDREVIERIELSISFLGEYRSALVAAAVTGKLAKFQ